MAPQGYGREAKAESRQSARVAQLCSRTQVSMGQEACRPHGLAEGVADLVDTLATGRLHGEALASVLRELWKGDSPS